MKVYFPFEQSYTPQEFLAETFSEQWLTHVQDVIRFWLSDEQNLSAKTSGSTGTPKDILLPRNLLLASAKATLQYLGFSGKADFLLAIPARFIGGKMLVLRALVGNHDLYLLPPKSEIEFVPKKFDLVSVTPMQAIKSLLVLHNFKQVLIGGGAVNPYLEEQLQTVKAQVYNTYGMTETASHVALKQLNGNKKSQMFEAIPGIYFSLDSRQCLVVHAPSWGLENLITNDVVKLVDKTHFIWLGRADHVINSGGIKVFPEEIEKVLMPQIKEAFFVTGVEDEFLGEKVVLLIESTQKRNIECN